jgi:hypothetical protein
MQVTRREFLHCAATTAAALAVRGRGKRESLGECVLLDLGEQCSLPESLAGYRAALAGAENVAGSILIVPAALGIVDAAAQRIVRHVEDGGTLIFESGATFTAARSPEFRGHRDALRQLLGLDVEPPRQLARVGTRTPYVEFRWPSPTLVRDFSAIVPVSALDDERIARVEDATVALARRRGRGMLIFLGSPIGPALWAGDPDARRWLYEVLRPTTQRSQLSAAS